MPGNAEDTSIEPEPVGETAQKAEASMAGGRSRKTGALMPN